MKVLIVEDEIYNFNSLKKMILSEYPQVEIDGPVTNLIDLNCAPCRINHTMTLSIVTFA